MQSLMKINGAWKEGTPYLKEGGTWKEIGAVTAKANGKWADIAPPKPAGKHWTNADFTISKLGAIKWKCVINSDKPQYFTVGDSFEVTSPFNFFTKIKDPSTSPKGLKVEDGKLVGIITGPPDNTSGRFEIEVSPGNGRAMIIADGSGKQYPIKPAP